MSQLLVVDSGTGAGATATIATARLAVRFAGVFLAVVLARLAVARLAGAGDAALAVLRVVVLRAVVLRVEVFLAVFFAGVDVVLFAARLAVFFAGDEDALDVFLALARLVVVVFAAARTRVWSSTVASAAMARMAVFAPAFVPCVPDELAMTLLR